MAVPRMRVNFSTNEENRPLHPNHLVYSKLERLIGRMLDEQTGVPIKTVKSFLSKIPSVFTGVDLVNWVLRGLTVSDLQESIHMCHLLSCHGYLFPIDDHILSVKNDGTFYRFQTPYFWPSNCWQPENTDYAVYLCKRTMQTKAHLELEDFEAENLARLQRMFSRKWEFIFMQAEAQYKVDKKRDRLERQILDSQERAFWDVHKPPPGCVNTTEVDFRKLSRWGARGNRDGIRSADVRSAASIVACSSHDNRPPDKVDENESDNENDSDTEHAKSDGYHNSAQGQHNAAMMDQSQLLKPVPGLRRCTLIEDAVKTEIQSLIDRLSRNAVKTSKVVESYISYFRTRKPYDPMLSQPDPPNPWIADTVDFWTRDQISGDISTRRVRSWSLGLDEVILDPKGREIFQKFLDKEYSGENLRFWLQVQRLRTCAQRMVPILVTEIYNEFLVDGATSAVNVDSKVMDTTEENLKCSNRWSFDEAAEHIYKLMKNDSYQRFLRSDLYNDLQNRSIHKPQRSLFGFKQTSAVYSVKET